MMIALFAWRKTITCHLAIPASALLLLTGCTSTEVGVQSAPEPICFEAIGTAFLEEAGQLSQTAPMNGASFVEATGLGFPADNAATGAQKELTALKAAHYGALAELAETLEGLQITRNARVQDMVFSGEEVTVTLSGIVQGASTVKEEYDPENELAKVCLRIALDQDENIILQRATRIAPTSLYKRRIEAEAAAQINAAAALREQIGQSHIMQHVEVKNLQFDSQQAQINIEGLLEGAQFSTPNWLDETQCTVKATLEITPTKRTATEKKEVH